MKDSLSNWLKDLPAVPAVEVERTSLAGRALSRTETHLYFATTDGVVTIPIEDIEDVKVRFPTDPNWAVLVLGTRRNLRQVRKPVRPRQANDDGPIIVVGPGVNTSEVTTTNTYDDPEYPTCDDSSSVDHQDDEFAP